MNSKIDIKKELLNAWHVALLKKTAMSHVGEDKSKTQFAYGIIIAGGLISLIGQQVFPAFFRLSLMNNLLMVVVNVAMTIAGIYLLSFIAQKLFKGHGKHDQFFRVVGYGFIVMWIGLLPMLGIIGGIWSLVIVFTAIKTIHKLDTGKTILTLLVGCVVMILISAVISPLYGGYSFSGRANYGMRNGYNPMEKGGNIKFDGGEMKFDNNTIKMTDENGETFEISIPLN